MSFYRASALMIAGLALAGTIAAAGEPQRATNAVANPPLLVLRELAPGGTLRAAINLGNAVLAQRHEVTGELQGVTVDIARELGRRLEVPVELVPFEAAGKVFDALQGNQWDIAFMAIEPARATDIDFTAPYVVIEATYMVRKESPLEEVTDVDRPGVRIAVGRGSAYDLYLTRTIRNATVVRAATGGNTAMIELFLAEKLEAVAGVRQQLAAYAAKDSGLRIMTGHFMDVPQAVGIPKGREYAPAFLRDFIEELKASGFVAASLQRSGQAGAVVPPPLPRR